MPWSLFLSLLSWDPLPFTTHPTPSIILSPHHYQAVVLNANLIHIAPHKTLQDYTHLLTKSKFHSFGLTMTIYDLTTHLSWLKSCFPLPKTLPLVWNNLDFLASLQPIILFYYSLTLHTVFQLSGIAFFSLLTWKILFFFYDWIQSSLFCEWLSYDILTVSYFVVSQSIRQSSNIQ